MVLRVVSGLEHEEANFLCWLGTPLGVTALRQLTVIQIAVNTIIYKRRKWRYMNLLADSVIFDQTKAGMPDAEMLENTG